MIKKIRMTITLLVSMAIALIGVAGSWAQSTTKNLSTNFTVVNLGSGRAQGSVKYFTEFNGSVGGAPWGNGSEDFVINEPGGQAIFRQYADPGAPGNPYLTNGAGSVVVMADQPLGAVVQILARGQNPTSSGAYSGFSNGASTFYIPLVARKLPTASGLGNSQIVVQNTSNSPVNVQIQLIGPMGSLVYTKTVNSLPPSASFYYDLALENSSNIPDGWYGSAVVRTTTSGGALAVVSNFFTGDALQTFNAFDSSSPTTKWFVPLFTSRLPNSLSTPIAVQNLSGDIIPAGGISVTCTPDPSLAGFSTFVMTNTSPILNTAAYYFNPVIDPKIPTGFYGSCVIDSSKNIVAFVQMRFIATGEAAAYEAIPAGGTDQTVIVPLVAKRLPNGFATAVTIQNLSPITATVTITYTPSPEYVANGGSSNLITLTGLNIPPYGSLIQNHRITSGPNAVSELPDGWYGTLIARSNRPIAGFVQLTFLRSINPSLPGGDTFMAHNAFTQP
jgi:hypothetical protein